MPIKLGNRAEDQRCCSWEKHVEPLEANRACLSVAGSSTSTVPLQIALFEHRQPEHFWRSVINGVKHGVAFTPFCVLYLYQTSRGSRDARLSCIEAFIFKFLSFTGNQQNVLHSKAFLLRMDNRSQHILLLLAALMPASFYLTRII